MRASRKIIERVFAVAPDLPVAISSGYTEAEVPSALEDVPVAGFSPSRTRRVSSPPPFVRFSSNVHDAHVIYQTRQACLATIGSPALQPKAD